MEPRPSERGNAHVVSGTHAALQASMEPRPSERGNGRHESAGNAPRLASMEPRPSERGNSSLAVQTACRRAALQWSHVLPNVETAHGQKPQITALAGLFASGSCHCRV